MTTYQGETMTDITDTADSPDMFMDDRLNLQALKNKSFLDQTLDFDFYQKIDKKELLAMLLKSTILMHEGANHIAQQRTTINRHVLDKLSIL
jgi:hypothetical protein